MSRFWKDKRGEPAVACWYYSVEVFGITYSFIDIERLRQFRDEIAARKFSSLRRLFSLHVDRHGNFFSFLMFGLKESYIHIRHREEVIRTFDQAYEQFQSEPESKEPVCQTKSSRDWR